MKISILTPDVSENCLGRALILARVLERRHEVEIVGPRFGESVWGPAAQEDVPIRAVPVGRGPHHAARLSRLAHMADGDVLYASKPLLASFGVALLARRRRRRPVVLDVDDWERGFSRDAFRALSGPGKLRHLVGSTLRPHLNYSFWSSRSCERWIGRADGLTVSNRFLQSRFGGTLVWHGRDTSRSAPGDDRDALRERHGVPRDAPVAVYLGTIRPYKGVDLLARAVGSLGDRGALLLLVGVGEDPFARRTVEAAREVLGERLMCRGVQPFERIEEYLALADVVAVPQRAGDATRGQMPAKLFDAMAAGRPIVATAVSDIPAVLEDCGWVVEPDSAEALARGITAALEDPDEAARRGRLARRRCEEQYSWDAMEQALATVFGKWGQTYFAENKSVPVFFGGGRRWRRRRGTEGERRTAGGAASGAR